MSAPRSREARGKREPGGDVPTVTTTAPNPEPTAEPSVTEVTPEVPPTTPVPVPTETTTVPPETTASSTSIVEVTPTVTTSETPSTSTSSSDTFTTTSTEATTSDPTTGTTSATTSDAVTPSSDTSTSSDTSIIITATTTSDTPTASDTSTTFSDTFTTTPDPTTSITSDPSTSTSDPSTNTADTTTTTSETPTTETLTATDYPTSNTAQHSPFTTSSTPTHHPTDTWEPTKASTWLPTSTWPPPEITDNPTFAALPSITGTTVVGGQTYAETTLTEPWTTTYTSRSIYTENNQAMTKDFVQTTVIAPGTVIIKHYLAQPKPRTVPIIAGAVAGFVALILLCGAILCIRRRRRQRAAAVGHSHVGPPDPARPPGLYPAMLQEQSLRQGQFRQTPQDLQDSLPAQGPMGTGSSTSYDVVSGPARNAMTVIHRAPNRSPSAASGIASIEGSLSMYTSTASGRDLPPTTAGYQHHRTLSATSGQSTSNQSTSSYASTTHLQPNRRADVQRGLSASGMEMVREDERRDLLVDSRDEQGSASVFVHQDGRSVRNMSLDDGRATPRSPLPAYHDGKVIRLEPEEGL
ncbi:hypothetical protein NMY22_g16373 [Coprinellus aureogranulatus]|nr:hypothetical protein NMY22_g16373 [Coprinellus aureogranulatus]